MTLTTEVGDGDRHARGAWDRGGSPLDQRSGERLSGGRGARLAGRRRPNSVEVAVIGVPARRSSRADPRTCPGS
ncbi:hypothetical protein STRIP9103_03401 [Streptomyces ipomoeae 91-03]|uniref:Uncharacterized protein n=1 Tax=Streptomyces ipomoeae 91-03 TaxID=698759 RepID=L1KKB8_9ACTN|nr:hypothetical protein STRIP9103_03401 [Streptomyces ipomoeae 91-03]